MKIYAKFKCITLLSLFAISFSALSLNSAVAQDKKPDEAAPVQAPADNKEYLLKRVYTKGDMDQFKYSAKVHTTVADLGGEVDLKLAMLDKESTLALKDDGEATVTTEVPEATVDFGGMEIDIASFMPKFTATRTKDGVKDVKAEGGRDGIQDQLRDLFRTMEEIQGAFFPKKAIKIGDSWKIVKETKEGDKASKNETTVKFVAVEEVDGVKTLRLEAKGDNSLNKDTIKQDVVANYDATTGKLVKGKIKIEGTSNGAPLKLDLNITQQPVVPKKEIKLEQKSN